MNKSESSNPLALLMLDRINFGVDAAKFIADEVKEFIRKNPTAWARADEEYDKRAAAGGDILDFDDMMKCAGYAFVFKCASEMFGTVMTSGN